jgi:ClpP class serine protease
MDTLSRMWPERKKLIAAIEQKRKSRLICYLTSDRQNASAIIAKDALPRFHNHLRQVGEVPRLDVLLFTSGGDTLAAFGLARLFREFAKWVGVLIPDRCLSAGTLVALGANQIYMTRAGTLSPIDPSVTTQLNPLSEGPVQGLRQLLPVSVESVAGFRNLIEEDWKIRKEEMLAQLLKVLSDKVHPLALGDVYRSQQQIGRLARQLLKKHRKKDDKQIQEIISTLTKDLGSHDYPISRTEARELLGKQVAQDDPELETLVWELFQTYVNEMNWGTPYNPGVEIAQAKEKAGTAGGIPPVRIRLDMAVIETLEARDTFEQEFVVSEAIIPGPTGPMKAVQQEVLDAGWKHYDLKEAHHDNPAVVA